MNTAAALERQSLTVDELVSNILEVWGRATDANREDGAQWYLLAGTIVADLAAAHGVTLEQSAAVVAHLSPRTPWARNVAGAAAVLAGVTMAGLMPANRARAEAAMADAAPLSTLKGPKTRSFAANMLGDPDAVTVDVWALRVALGVRPDLELLISRKGVYDAIADCYRIAAARVGVTPATMQATTWIVARGGRAN